jgi:hypothetical protein
MLIDACAIGRQASTGRGRQQAMEETTAGDIGIPEEEPSICRDKPSFYVLRRAGELAEERLRVLEIGGVKAFGEPVVT